MNDQYTAFGVRPCGLGVEVYAVFFSGPRCTGEQFVAYYSDFGDACGLAAYLARKELQRIDSQRPGLLRRIGEMVGLCERRAG